MKANLAEIAYEAYRKQSGGVSLVSGQPIPAFEELQDDIKVAWHEAAQAVIAATTNFRFQLGDEVALRYSSETAVVIGRAHYEKSEPGYYLRYRAADGRQTECWWQDSAIK